MVVPSPKPISIVEAETIRKLVDMGSIVIAAGGGGIPTVHDKGNVLKGIEAVVKRHLRLLKFFRLIRIWLPLVLRTASYLR